MYAHKCSHMCTHTYHKAVIDSIHSDNGEVNRLLTVTNRNLKILQCQAIWYGHSQWLQNYNNKKLTKVVKDIQYAVNVPSLHRTLH